MNDQQSAITTRAERALFGSWLTTALACLGVVVPKCPLCAAAYLCLFGVSASSAQAVVKLGLPLCIALVAGSALATAWFVARRGQRVRRCCQSARQSSGT
ncbi:MAG: hypothetical protein WDO69_10575 [Pseudomonadota bacterium]